MYQYSINKYNTYDNGRDRYRYSDGTSCGCFSSMVSERDYHQWYANGFGYFQL